jgi:glutamyl/glutaminyl-tRNA synthetase
LKLPTKYDKKCRFLTPEETKSKLDNKEPYTVRLKVPENEKIVFEDMVK